MLGCRHCISAHACKTITLGTCELIQWHLSKKRTSVISITPVSTMSRRRNRRMFHKCARLHKCPLAHRTGQLSGLLLHWYIILTNCSPSGVFSLLCININLNYHSLPHASSQFHLLYASSFTTCRCRAQRVRHACSNYCHSTVHVFQIAQFLEILQHFANNLNFNSIIDCFIYPYRKSKHPHPYIHNLKNLK